ncbi:MAG TPA: FAD-binding protein, partial [Nocardioidaceae bacterium]|nr:FAD-binding protein [Nocardioidaceae bacterium]
HVRFEDLGALAKAVETVVDEREWDGIRVDAVDGVVFEPTETYLTLANWRHGFETPRSLRGGLVPRPPQGAASAPQPAPSDYTGQDIYYRSLQARETDMLTIYDYLWRWDTDWFWCSRAFGAQHPRVRRWWPRRYRRSDVYHKLVGLENRFGVMAHIDAARGKPARERVIQDVEIPVERLAEFLAWFDEHVAMRPVWLCPLRLREPAGPVSARSWPSYPLVAGTTYVNVGFWGTVPIAEGAQDGDLNRAIERRVTELGGHKSLYSDAYYDRATFDRLYNGANHAAVKKHYDPSDRLTGLYEKAVKRR